ncbi:hypothetical protein HW561_04920 [Rhodobacteraceae bacterium B1Z28]|uniref:Uncharacterized protein n=1 Tax=Ruegeria haliotis TaxID=2747601 RepID=A0ABX2PPY0_9RHOB|nr:hypothetical protein [Ruegeria haliotis]NVO55129.1 hypothetical protein [Ruegeria haliotis]
MSATLWIYGFCGMIALAGSIAIVKAIGRPKGSNRERGVEPGQGDSIIDHGTAMGISGGGHPTASRVTKDPQEYAKAMAPKK